jgi:hypothetical protein
MSLELCRGQSLREITLARGIVFQTQTARTIGTIARRLAAVTRAYLARRTPKDRWSIGRIQYHLGVMQLVAICV